MINWKSWFKFSGYVLLLALVILVVVNVAYRIERYRYEATANMVVKKLMEQSKVVCSEEESNE